MVPVPRALDVVNARVPTNRSRHILIQHFAIQDWKDQGHIRLCHIAGVNNPVDDLTKPLGWILHSRHACRLMGHYSTVSNSSIVPVSFSSFDLIPSCQDQGRLLNETPHESIESNGSQSPHVGVDCMIQLT